MELKMKNAMIAWNPGNIEYGEDDIKWPVGIKVGPWPDVAGWSKPYLKTVGACCLNVHANGYWLQRLYAVTEALIIIVRDGVPAEQVHAEMCKIQEYRDSMPADIGMPNAYLQRVFQDELREMQPVREMLHIS